REWWNRIISGAGLQRFCVSCRLAPIVRVNLLLNAALSGLGSFPGRRLLPRGRCLSALLAAFRYIVGLTFQLVCAWHGSLLQANRPVEPGVECSMMVFRHRLELVLRPRRYCVDVAVLTPHEV